ncbi:MAG TPA: sigma-70 family RNA polymerase sigma factor [Desulfomonilia bacterium]|nr:sigma-70 family RNA polymerase sigma factor [Desulfomonilia bacterium]
MSNFFDYSDFQMYCKEIQQYSTLTYEQEYELAKRYQKGDEAAGQQIIQSNLRFVVKVSRKYFYCGHNCLEIVQEGNLGLIRALNRFDPDRGIPFIYYAVWWVEATIKAFMQKSGKVHTGCLSHAKNLFSLDESLGNNDTDKDRWIDFLTDGTDPEKLYNSKEASYNISSLLHHCFTYLSPREVSVLKQRFYADPPVKLKEIGMQLGVSRERVRQIQTRSMEKLKQALEDQADTFWETNTVDSQMASGSNTLGFLHRGEYPN